MLEVLEKPHAARIVSLLYVTVVAGADRCCTAGLGPHASTGLPRSRVTHWTSTLQWRGGGLGVGWREQRWLELQACFLPEAAGRALPAAPRTPTAARPTATHVSGAAPGEACTISGLLGIVFTMIATASSPAPPVRGYVLAAVEELREMT